MCMGLALPCALALLPEEMEIDVNELEEEFHNLKDKDGKKIKEKSGTRADRARREDRIPSSTRAPVIKY